MVPLFLPALAAIALGADAIYLFTHPAVIVEWSIPSELNTVGFNLYRSEDQKDDFHIVNDRLIPSSSDALVGGDYFYRDVSVRAGHTYYYLLEYVDGNGVANRNGPIQVKAEFGGIPEMVVTLLLAFFATGYSFDLIETYTIFGDLALKILSPYLPGPLPTSLAQMRPAGTDVSYQFSVQNLGSITDTYKLTGSGNTWVSDFTSSIGPLSPGGKEIEIITVHIPPDAALGTKDKLNLSLASIGDIGKVVTSTLYTTVASDLFIPVVSK